MTRIFKYKKLNDVEVQYCDLSPAVRFKWFKEYELTGNDFFVFKFILKKFIIRTNSVYITIKYKE